MKISLRSTVIALGVVAMLAALMFTVKLLATDWNGQIGDTQTITLDPSQCAGGSGGSSGPCYKTVTCAPSADKCECTEEGDWH